MRGTYALWTALLCTGLLASAERRKSNQGFLFSGRLDVEDSAGNEETKSWTLNPSNGRKGGQGQRQLKRTAMDDYGESRKDDWWRKHSFRVFPSSRKQDSKGGGVDHLPLGSDRFMSSAATTDLRIGNSSEEELNQSLLEIDLLKLSNDSRNSLNDHSISSAKNGSTEQLQNNTVEEMKIKLNGELESMLSEGNANESLSTKDDLKQQNNSVDHSLIDDNKNLNLGRKIQSELRSTVQYSTEENATENVSTSAITEATKEILRSRVDYLDLTENENEKIREESSLKNKDALKSKVEYEILATPKKELNVRKSRVEYWKSEKLSDKLLTTADNRERNNNENQPRKSQLEYLRPQVEYVVPHVDYVVPHVDYVVPNVEYVSGKSRHDIGFPKRRENNLVHSISPVSDPNRISKNKNSSRTPHPKTRIENEISGGNRNDFSVAVREREDKNRRSWVEYITNMNERHNSSIVRVPPRSARRSEVEYEFSENGGNAFPQMGTRQIQGRRRSEVEYDISENGGNIFPQMGTKQNQGRSEVEYDISENGGNIFPQMGTKQNQGRSEVEYDISENGGNIFPQMGTRQNQGRRRSEVEYGISENGGNIFPQMGTKQNQGRSEVEYDISENGGNAFSQMGTRQNQGRRRSEVEYVMPEDGRSGLPQNGIERQNNGGKRREMEPSPKERDETPVNDGIRGTANKDYPTYKSLPKTGFHCRGHQLPGYYGDVEARCQVFHVCHSDGRRDSFLCPVGTVFNQQYLVCDWWYNVDCSETPQFYSPLKAEDEEADDSASENIDFKDYSYETEDEEGEEVMEEEEEEIKGKEAGLNHQKLKLSNDSGYDTRETFYGGSKPFVQIRDANHQKKGKERVIDDRWQIMGRNNGKTRSPMFGNAGKDKRLADTEWTESIPRSVGSRNEKTTKVHQPWSSVWEGSAKYESPKSENKWWRDSGHSKRAVKEKPDRKKNIALDEKRSYPTHLGANWRGATLMEYVLEEQDGNEEDNLKGKTDIEQKKLLKTQISTEEQFRQKQTEIKPEKNKGENISGGKVDKTPSEKYKPQFLGPELSQGVLQGLITKNKMDHTWGKRIISLDSKNRNDTKRDNATNSSNDQTNPQKEKDNVTNGKGAEIHEPVTRDKNETRSQGMDKNFEKNKGLPISGKDSTTSVNKNIAINVKKNSAMSVDKDSIISAQKNNTESINKENNTSIKKGSSISTKNDSSVNIKKIITDSANNSSNSAKNKKAQLKKAPNTPTDIERITRINLNNPNHKTVGIISAKNDSNSTKDNKEEPWQGLANVPESIKSIVEQNLKNLDKLKFKSVLITSKEAYKTSYDGSAKYHNKPFEIRSNHTKPSISKGFGEKLKSWNYQNVSRNINMGSKKTNYSSGDDEDTINKSKVSIGHGGYLLKRLNKKEKNEGTGKTLPKGTKGKDRNGDLNGTKSDSNPLDIILLHEKPDKDPVFDEKYKILNDISTQRNNETVVEVVKKMIK